MSSTENILLNPIPELTAALQTNTWGIDPSSEIIVADCFPITPEDVDSVRNEVKEKGASGRVVGKARIVSLEGTSMVVVLDQRGFTVRNSSSRQIALFAHPARSEPITLKIHSRRWSHVPARQRCCIILDPTDPRSRALRRHQPSPSPTKPMRLSKRF